MEKNCPTYRNYVEILRRELVPAMGCTEPIAIAYCAAKARAVLGCLPDKVTIAASGNIIKNVKSVIVPNTGGRKGIELPVTKKQASKSSPMPRMRTRPSSQIT